MFFSTCFLFFSFWPQLAISRQSTTLQLPQSSLPLNFPGPAVVHLHQHLCPNGQVLQNEVKTELIKKTSLRPRFSICTALQAFQLELILQAVIILDCLPGFKCDTADSACTVVNTWSMSLETKNFFVLHLNQNCHLVSLLCGKIKRQFYYNC